MSTLKTTNLQNASAASPAIVLAADGSATAQLSSINGGPLAGARNRIINGDMRIDQRNNGASVTPNNNYTLDRWLINNSQTGKLTIQQSSTAPTGFSKSLLVTSSSAYTVTSTDYFVLQQRIEGFNFDDFAYGTANAKTATLSFWVRSSLTGTFGGAFENESFNRSYPFSYTISAANTWEYKTITIAGDTTGTWTGGTNGIGLVVVFGLGVGSTYSGTAGAWAGSNYNTATGATSVVGTNGATFYITGVQLEPGTVATLFERIDYSESLRRCQRYYQVLGPSDTLTTGTTICVMPQADTGAVNENWGMTEFKVSMRAAPTVSASSWELAGHHGNTPIIAAGTKYALFRYDGSNFRGSGGRLIANNAQASAEL